MVMMPVCILEKNGSWKSPLRYGVHIETVQHSSFVHYFLNIASFRHAKPTMVRPPTHCIIVNAPIDSRYWPITRGGDRLDDVAPQ